MTVRRTPPDSHPHSVRDLCETFGVTPRTLRYYGATELLPPHRVGDARFYSDADRARLAEILRLKSLGLTLRAIFGLFAAQDAGDDARRDALLAAACVEQLETTRRSLRELLTRGAALEAELAELGRRAA
ncbi:MAG: MerR family transcriptional regulator [Pseudomonadota bacterium]|nr:MerR family transcriptional regulator [Pseudomonadota bacterium]MEE3098597.1 MerR family transcriptional regulator [Pseudomonadota bacterium]